MLTKSSYLRQMPGGANVQVLVLDLFAHMLNTYEVSFTLCFLRCSSFLGLIVI